MHGTVCIGDAVHLDAPLNRGLRGWWMVLPGQQRGSFFRDLCLRNHGPLTGGATWSGAGGRAGGYGAVFFDGTDDIVDTGYAPGATINSGFTIALWLFQRNRTGEQVHAGFEDAGQNGFGGIEVEISSLNAATPRAMWDTGSNLISLTDYALTTWSHVAVTKTGTTFAAYVNGKLQGSLTISDIATTNTQTFQMGGADTARRFAGCADSARVYNRALPAGEICELYREERLGCPTTLNWTRSRVASEQAAAGSTLSRRYYDLMLGGMA